MNKPLCPSCYSQAVYPSKPSALSYPDSLENTALSPSVLASIGATICKQQKISPAIGMAVGAVAGIALSISQDKPSLISKSCLRLPKIKVRYYCSNCQQIFNYYPVSMRTVVSPS